MTHTADAKHMRRAIALARRGWGQTSPNPMVGAVIVRDGKVVGEGFHARFGANHAEVGALRAAGDLARDATMYVNLEPCAHTGQTPPCVDAIIAAGVARVVIAARDPNPVAAGGLERLAASGIEAEVGIESTAARELNAPFFNSFTSDRPWVTLKLAISLDAAVADAGGRSQWITGAKARRAVHLLRSGHDAIAVGIGTALADDPSLTVRGVRAPRVRPLRVVFDRPARLPSTGKLARTAAQVPTLLVTETSDEERLGALRVLGVEVLIATSLAMALETLRTRGVRSLLVEGGAKLAGALLADDLVNRLIIFQAPLLLGSGSRNAFTCVPPEDLSGVRRMKVIERRIIGEDTMTTYAPRDE